ncbi:hypothetical protein KZP23_08690 [Echinicola marina]|uniref:hypothetical protein n=1 Tax=Echinicola marina TaxID=2859768 RepID=UPI001CF6E501|nr:hypothetical protein [Echinicola marina]UCS95071.1 hypothetical protein KZP23_08690 [Echinicola marina]
MNILFLFLWFYFLPNNVKKDIIIEHQYLPRIDASSISDEVKLISMDRDYHNIQSMVITEKSLFISPGEYNKKGFAYSICKLDKAGRFLKEIYRNNEHLIKDLAFDELENRLLIAHSNSIVIYDISNDKILQSISIQESINNLALFKGKVYTSGISNEFEEKTYFMDSYNAKDLKFEKRHLDLSYESSSINIFNPSTLTINKGELYSAIGEDNVIYSSSDRFQAPVFQFKNLSPGKKGQDIFSGYRGLVGKYTTTHFSHKNQVFILFYDLTANKQYLSKTGTSAGVFDDFNDSGYYHLQFTNLSSYMYAFKRKTSDHNATLALFKIKS